MNDDIKAGDVVVCVNDDDCPIYPGSNGGIVRDAVYRVIAAKPLSDIYGCARLGVQLDRHNVVHPLSGAAGFHNAVRFRKIDAPKTELSERIKACRPVREDA